MEWQHPKWLYLILPLAVAWLALALYSRQRQRLAAVAFVAQAMRGQILPTESRSRFWSKLLLREIALVTGLTALAGPRFGTQYEEVIPRGSDLYVLIDVSRSMLAEDVPPSRLGRAKADVAALVNRLEGERIGLIAFAGQAVVKCPLTVDYDAFRRSLDELDPGSAPRGGTAIGDAIRKALEVFHARTERDQAILLITDGDDQQSYPLEAAAVAAERHVTIFTVGLGDADQGARIPQGAGSKSYIEYQGQQVWSKLDGSLLKEIALKTSGAYVPAGTRAYDLGELYVDHLHGRRGSDEANRKRLRRAEQFQIFLSISLLTLLVDLLILPYSVSATQSKRGGFSALSDAKSRRRARLVTIALILVASFGRFSRADDPVAGVREGLRLYRDNEFGKAQEAFSAARVEFDKQEPGKAAIAAFDEACAWQKKGDVTQARESYLKAGLAHDNRLAAAAHFNLGSLAVDEARRLAGERPEEVPAEKRQEILGQLKGAVASFRHSLQLQGDQPGARRNIELIRLWIKYYSDKWAEHDRRKRREETNLLAFLEFLIETQKGLRESVHGLPATPPADTYADLKRLQEELRDEIVPLREKIRAELQSPHSGNAVPPGGNSDELEQGIKLLESWADSAGEKMTSAATDLDARRADAAADYQQSAIDELEKIWDAVIPFQPLLARNLADQTIIVRVLEPAVSKEPKALNGQPADQESESTPEEPGIVPSGKSSAAGNELIESDDARARLSNMQERTRRRTQLLKLKAEAEFERLVQQAAPEAKLKAEGDDTTKDQDSSDAAELKTPDPEQLKAGLQVAIERAPQAVEQMEAALKALRQTDRQAAYVPAEEARKILEEILKAQPRNEQKDQNQQERDKKDDSKKEEQDESEKGNEQKNQSDKADKQEQEQKNPNEQNQTDDKKPDQKPRQQQVSRDQIEEALRKVRERQQEKRERDRKIKARVGGKIPVEKDW